MTPSSSSSFSEKKNSSLASSISVEEVDGRKNEKSGDCKNKRIMSTTPVIKNVPTDSEGKRKSSVVTPTRSCRTAGKRHLSSPIKIPSQSNKKLQNQWNTKNQVTTSEKNDNESEASFENYSELCERVAKTMYYVNPILLPSTPRPSLPLTILAVDTFSKYARKDTLEFLDIDMAAEIGRSACVSPTALVFALVYLERLSMNNPGYLKTVKPSELFVVSLLVASKFVQDDGEDLGIFNDEWATSAQMELKRINRLELEFLTAIDWRVNVGKVEYERTMQSIEQRLAFYQGSKRGWFTYTELSSLANSHLSWNVILPVIYERVLEVISATCIMYTTFFATLLTSSALAPYLLSVTKLSMSLAFLGTTSSPFGFTHSCLQTFANESRPMTGSSFFPGDHVQSSAEITVLPSIDDQENLTENLAIAATVTHAWNEPIGRINAAPYNKYGFSFQCGTTPGLHCYQQQQEQALAGLIQSVVENLLQTTNTNMDAIVPYMKQGSVAESNGLIMRESCNAQIRNCGNPLRTFPLSTTKPLRV